MPRLDDYHIHCPGVNHGTAISAVLQEALRINVAVLQKEVVVPVSRLKRYVGMYMSTADSAVSNKVFLRDGQLYIVLRGHGDDYALQLHTASPNIFF